MLKKILIGLAGFVVLVIALGFVLPAQQHAERDIVINAPQEQVYALVGDLNNFNRWSPWAELDPNAQYTLTGSGIGQKQTWASDKSDVGSGSQEIVTLDPPNLVVTHLDFGAMGVATGKIALSPVDGGTRVVWSIDCNMRERVPVYMAPLYTYMGFFMDQMMAPNFERGLANLKRVAEAS